jgi:hypothetical protein
MQNSEPSPNVSALAKTPALDVNTQAEAPALQWDGYAPTRSLF